MNQDKRGYWYRSKRMGKRVVRQYVGRGEAPCRAARQDALKRDRDADQRAQLKAEGAKLDEFDQEIEALCQMTSEIMRQQLEAAGYFQHDRGAWRKRRTPQNQNQNQPPDQQSELQGSRTMQSKQSRALEPVNPAMANPLIIIKADEAAEIIQDGMGAETRDLAEAKEEAKQGMQHIQDVQKAEKGDQAAFKRVMAAIESEPETLQFLMNACGNWAATTEQVLLDKVCGKNLIGKEATRRQLAALRLELAGPIPSPSARMMAERVALCRLQVNDLETHLILNSDKGKSAVEHLDKRLDRAHRRYLASIKALAQVQRLQLPVLPSMQIGQVNVAEQQVNTQVNVEVAPPDEPDTSRTWESPGPI